MSTHGLVGDLLINAGVVNAAGLARALAAQSADRSTLGRALAGLGLAEESVVAATIASGLHLEYLEGEPPDVEDTVTTLLTEEFCRTHRSARDGASGPAAGGRPASRRADDSAPSAGRDDLPSQDHGRHGHRGAAQASGRPEPAAVRGPADRSPGFHDANSIRGKDRHSTPEH